MRSRVLNQVSPKRKCSVHFEVSFLDLMGVACIFRLNVRVLEGSGKKVDKRYMYKKGYSTKYCKWLNYLLKVKFFLRVIMNQIITQRSQSVVKVRMLLTNSLRLK